MHTYSYGDDVMLSWVLNGKYIYIAYGDDGSIMGFATTEYRPHRYAPVWIRALCVTKVRTQF